MAGLDSEMERRFDKSISELRAEADQFKTRAQSDPAVVATYLPRLRKLLEAAGYSRDEMMVRDDVQRTILAIADQRPEALADEYPDLVAAFLDTRETRVLAQRLLHNCAELWAYGVTRQEITDGLDVVEGEIVDQLADIAEQVDDDGRVGFQVSERFQFVDRVGLIRGLAGAVDVVRKTGSLRWFRALSGTRGVGIREAVVPDFDGVALGAVVVLVYRTDRDSGVLTERRDEAAAELTRHVVDAERGYRERLVEGIVALGPVVELGREQNVEAAAVDGADGAPDCVGRALVVAVEDDRLLSPAEQFAGFSGADVLERPILGRRDGGTVRDGEARGLDGVDGRGAGGVGAAGEHECAALVRALGLRPEVGRERGEDHARRFARPGFARFGSRVGR